MHYYQFNIGDYKSHTEHLSEMEDLTYRRLLDWYYLHECPIPVDEIEVARQIRMRSHSDCIAVVLREYFEQTPDGWIHHRADKELAKAGEKSSKASLSAKARWDKKANKNIDLAFNANALRTQSEGNATHNTEHITQDTKHSRKSNRGTRLSPDFVCPKEWIDFCFTKRPDLDFQDTFDQFKDYWCSVPGDKANKTDWQAAWRNWVRRQNAPKNTQISSTGQMNKKVISGLTRGLLGGDNNVQLLGN
jgi:uncharacterized protein YdaU (DUF1376 family)